MKSLKIKVLENIYNKIKKIPEKKNNSLIIKSFQKEYNEVIDDILQAEIKNDGFKKKYKKSYGQFVKNMNNSKKEHDDYIEWTFYNNILKT